MQFSEGPGTGGGFGIWPYTKDWKEMQRSIGVWQEQLYDPYILRLNLELQLRVQRGAIWARAHICKLQEVRRNS